MGDIVTFRGRPTAPETPDDYRDEVTALRAEMAELIVAVRPVVARLAVYGVNRSPVVLEQARVLASLLERPASRTLGGAA